MITIRTINETDYEQYVVPMWESWNSPAPPKDFLPEEGIGGYIVFDGEIPVSCGFTYVTNSLCAWAEWLCTNKNYTNRNNRKIALNLLLDTMTNVCIKLGYKYIFAVVKSEPLIKIYEESGFTKSVQGFEMFKKI